MYPIIVKSKNYLAQNYLNRKKGVKQFLQLVRISQAVKARIFNFKNAAGIF